MNSEQNTRNTEAVYDETGKLAGNALLLLLESLMKKKLDLTVERVDANQLGLTVERVDEKQSGLTVERVDQNQLESNQNAATVLEEVATKAKPQVEEPTAKQQEEELPRKPQLLFGQEDGKPVNRMTDEEAVAIAKILTRPKGKNVPGGENLRIKYNGVVIAETNAQGQITINEAYGKLDPQVIKQIEEAIKQVPQSKAIDHPVAAVAVPKPETITEPEKNQPETKRAVSEPIKRTTAEALTDLLESAQSAGANLIAGIIKKVDEHNRSVNKEQGQDQTVNSEKKSQTALNPEAEEYLANKQILAANPKDYTAWQQITDVHSSRTGQIRDLIEWTAENAATEDAIKIDNGYFVPTDRGYIVDFQELENGDINYQLSKDGDILIEAQGSLETGILKVKNYSVDDKKEIAAEIKAMRADLVALKANEASLDSGMSIAYKLPSEYNQEEGTIELPNSTISPIIWQDKGLITESQANHLVEWASSVDQLKIPDGETEKKVQSSKRPVEIIAKMDGTESSTIAYELHDKEEDKSLRVSVKIKDNTIQDVDGVATPLIFDQIEAIEEVLELKNQSHIPSIEVQTPINEPSFGLTLEKEDAMINESDGSRFTQEDFDKEYPEIEEPVQNNAEVKTAIDKLQESADRQLGNEESGVIEIDDGTFKLMRYENEVAISYKATGKDGGVVEWEIDKENDQAFLIDAKLSPNIQLGVETLSSQAQSIEKPTPTQAIEEPSIQMSAAERIAAQRLANEQSKNEPNVARTPAKAKTNER